VPWNRNWNVAPGVEAVAVTAESQDLMSSAFVERREYWVLPCRFQTARILPLFIRMIDGTSWLSTAAVPITWVWSNWYALEYFDTRTLPLVSLPPTYQFWLTLSQ
jgi:hypothetical protein